MEQKTRCGWCDKDDLYRQYHDEEWGVPEYDDAKLFEMLILETFQAGLSWHTILKKRTNFREAFDGFNVQKVAQYNENKVAELLANAGIIRNKLKIRGAIKNAQGFIKIQAEFGSFSHYIWDFVNHKTLVNRPTELHHIQSTSLISDAISHDLKKRGFAFCGSTVIYAHMQATGMVNDHLLSCWKRKDG